MQVRKLILSDVCQHAHLEWTFTSGVNGILGPNGSGKTNALAGMEFSLTGDWPLFGTKADQVRWGATAAFVEMHIVGPDNTPGVIKRALHTSHCTMSYGSEKIKSADAVNAKIREIMASGTRVLQQFVFVKQARVNQVLFSRAAERSAMFNVLFGTDFIESRRQLLTRELQTVVPVTLAADRDTLVRRIQETAQRLQDMQQKLTSVQQQMAAFNEPELRQRLTQQKTEYEIWHHPQNGYQALAEQHSSLNNQIQQLTHDITTRTERQQQLKQTLAELNAEVNQARNRLVNVEQASRLNESRQHAQAQMDKLAGELAMHPEPAVIKDNDVVMDLYESAELVPLENQARDIQNLINGFTSVPAGQRGQCPTCGTCVVVNGLGDQTDLQALLQQKWNALQVLQPQVKKMRAELEAYRLQRQQSQAAHSQWTQWKQYHQYQIEQAQNYLQKLGQGVAVDATTAAADRDLVEAYDLADSQFDNLTLWLAKQGPALTRLQEIAQQVNTQLQVMPASAPSREAAAATQAFITQWESLRQTFDTVNGQVSEAQRSLHDLQARQVELDALTSKSKAIDAYRQLVSRVHGVLHRDFYPSAVARRHFDSLNRGWNQMLRMLDVKYTVAIQPDSDILVSWPQGSAPIEKCSGGERSCASMSFLMTVNRLFAGQIGFLVMDEPTDGVDEYHLGQVKDLLLEVQKYSAATNLQVIVVTHAEQLRDGFNHCLELTGA
jgi:DNA repair exonuclease SbcCD ATPase subunit